MGVRWSLASPLSDRHVEALREARGGPSDHATVQRWVVQESPPLAEACHRRQRPGWVSWRRDETESQVHGPWSSLYGAVAKTGQTIDVLRTAQRDEHAATRCLPKASRRHGVPEQRPIDGSAAQAAAIKRSKEAHGTALAIRQGQSRKTIVAQDHRGVQRVTRPLGGCTALEAAPATLVGIARLPRSKKRPWVVEEGDEGRTAAEPVDALAASSSPQTGATAPS
jgi:putative transposase